MPFLGMDNIHSNGEVNSNLSKVEPSLNLDATLVTNSSMAEVFDQEELQNVRSLSLRNNMLIHLPKNIFLNLHSLTKLDISENTIKELPSTIDLLLNLEHLKADGNTLAHLPHSIGRLKKLKFLSVADNVLVDVPASLADADNLQELNLSVNNLADLPNSCARLENLIVLALSRNNITKLPYCLVHGMSSIEILDISHNARLDLSTTPLLSTKVKKLFLNDNGSHKKFPSWILTKRSLEELILDNTSFKEFNILKRFQERLCLKKLSMVRCGLSDSVFEKISMKIVNLESLHLGNDIPRERGDLFWTMPLRNWKNPESLTELVLRATRLPAIPQEVGKLKNLKKLDVSHNSISWLPNDICQLEKLEILRVGHNSLHMIPHDIGRMSSLKELCLNKNMLSSLPDSITDLKDLEYLDLYQNDFSEIPVQLEKMGKLKGLDIDGNACKLDNLSIGSEDYKVLRAAMRTNCDTRFARCIGSICNELPGTIDNFQNYGSSDDDSEDDIINVDTDVQPEITVESTENWDLSTDSADEYDPTVPERPIKARISPLEGIPSLRQKSSREPVSESFPADLHNMCIRDQVAILNRKNCNKTKKYEDGQFDDA